MKPKINPRATIARRGARTAIFVVGQSAAPRPQPPIRPPEPKTKPSTDNARDNE